MATALVTIVGYIVAVFAAGNILLPLFWAWPKAMKLQREGRLHRPIPAVRFVVPAVVGILILLGPYVLIGWLVQERSGYVFGVIVGALQNLRLVIKPNAHMEADFDDSYGEYLRADKYAEALFKVTANLLEVATEPARPNHAPQVLRFERPDGKLRYAAFCLGFTYYFSVNDDTLQVMEEAVRKVWARIEELAADESTGLIVERASDNARAIVIQEAREELARTVDGWREYVAHFHADQRDGRALKRDEASARIVCRMLRRLETDELEVLTEADTLRLKPLAQWIEETTASIQPSVEGLLR